MAASQKLVPPKTLARKNPVHFPNESKAYRKARDNLLAKEIELRRDMEDVAAARRKLPSGGRVREDYVFDGLGPNGQTVKIKLSDLFAPARIRSSPIISCSRAILKTIGQDPRHNGTIEPLWNLMDLTPEGRPSNWHEQLAYDERRKA